ncbi:MAG: peptidylprolyl isomerase [Polyangiaceae bacterium]|nr:peptidylprolyl isomerase [Polyangiaceae bacterium]
MTRDPNEDPTPSTYAVSPEMRVALGYRLFDAEGELVEASGEEDTFEVLFGLGQLSPELEQLLEGARVGQVRSIELDAARAFGRRDPDRVIEVDRTELPDDVQVGDELGAETEDGEPVVLRVLELESDFAVLDSNHPLADQSVRLELLIEDVWPATSEEIAEAEALLADADGPLIDPASLLRR